MGALIQEFSPDVRRSRARRRTVGLRLAEGRLIVNVPHTLGAHDIEKVLQKHENWVRKKLADAKKQQAASRRKGHSGEGYLYKGREYMLQVQRVPAGYLAHVRREEDYLVLHLPPKIRARTVLEGWYMERAQAYLITRTSLLAARYGITYRNITIGDYKTRWGSCSRFGNLRFCWRIMMAPPKVIDYLIIHELMHRKVFSHSPRFWAAVEAAMPDYDTPRKWLRDNAATLGW
ncbi:MAG: SprT family zinc-dependent metalloprotease [Alphaproteobacteria bacterium]